MKFTRTEHKATFKLLKKFSHDPLNFHFQETGVCTACSHNTKGEHCDECADGYYGDPKLGSGSQCTACPCPDGPGSGRQFAESCRMENPISRDDQFRGPRPDMPVIVCECNGNYTGPHCDQCAPGYYGNPHEVGGGCQVTVYSD